VKPTPIDLGKASTPARAAAPELRAHGAIRAMMKPRLGCRKAIKLNSTKRAGVIEARQRMAAAFRRTHTVAERTQAGHPDGRRQLRHEAAQGRARGAGMAGGYGSADPGRRSRRANDVRSDRRHAGVEPARRTGV